MRKIQQLQIFGAYFVRLLFGVRKGDLEDDNNGKNKGLKIPKKTMAFWALMILLVNAIGLPILSKTRGLLRSNSDGPPSNLVVHGKRSFYAKPPDEFRRHFYVIDNCKFPVVYRRAFRNRGWIQSDSIEDAHFVFSKSDDEDVRYDQFQPWQRYSLFPEIWQWDTKDGFLSGFKRYKAKNPDVSLYFLPETYRLGEQYGEREEFASRLAQPGAMDFPWVLKKPEINNGHGVEMLGPHSDELENVLERLEDADDDNYIIQAYVCNELKFHGRKFDLRMYWSVLSIDPLIVAFHDGYSRVGSLYNEKDFSVEGAHLTNHEFRSTEATMEEVYEVVRQHYQENKYELSEKIKIDPVKHIRNQMKEALSATISAFLDVTFGNDREVDFTAENAFGYFGADFIIDNDLDVWYLEAQNGPGQPEEYDFQVELHRDMLHTLIDTVEEITNKQQANPAANLLPLKNLGGWEIVYAQGWDYRYEGYKRATDKKGCDILLSVGGKVAA